MKKQKNFKRINKFISKAIIGTMIISNMIPSIAFANEIQEITENGERETLVTYEANAYFAVTIPKHITLNGITKSAEYNINVRGDIPSDAKVIVSPEDKISNVEGINFYMVEQAVNKKEDVVATVTQNETEWSSSEVTSTGTSKNGFISAPNLTSGKWQGTFIFNISLLDNSKDHTHNYVDGVCTECEEKDPSTEYCNHTYVDGICTECGEKDPNVEEHTHNYTESITKEATCTESGEKTLTCACGDIKTETIPMTEHNYGEDDKCTNCGVLNFEHNHSYVENITKTATCTESGEKTLTCSCGDTKTEEIPIIEHNYVDGVCTECGDSVIVYSTLRSTASESSGTSGFMGSNSINSSVTRSKITSISFSNYENSKDHYLTDNNCWDVSDAQDGSIIAWYTQNTNGYAIYIAPTKENIILRANENCSFMFANFNNPFSDIFNYDTIDFSNTTNMNYMFYGTSINIGTFNIDTSNVTTTRYMFAASTYPLEGQILWGSKVDFSNVTDSSYMFNEQNTLMRIAYPTGLTVIGERAFYNCKSLVMDLIIPDNVESIGTLAFRNVPHVIYNGTATGSPWGAKSIN